MPCYALMHRCIACDAQSGCTLAMCRNSSSSSPDLNQARYDGQPGNSAIFCTDTTPLEYFLWFVWNDAHHSKMISTRNRRPQTWHPFLMQTCIPEWPALSLHELTKYLLVHRSQVLERWNFDIQTENEGISNPNKVRSCILSGTV